MWSHAAITFYSVQLNLEISYDTTDLSNPWTVTTCSVSILGQISAC